MKIFFLNAKNSDGTRFICVIRARSNVEAQGLIRGQVVSCHEVDPAGDTGIVYFTEAT